MNPIFSFTPLSQGLIPAQTSRRLDRAHGLAALMLAAGLATLVVLADQLIGTWADGHLFLGWVALWLVVLVGTPLLAAPARGLAASALRSAHGWSRALHEARAEMRLWQTARADHRVMDELMQARQRDLDDEPPVAWGRFPEQLADGRGPASHLRHL